jgi:hypothetical protein
MGRCPKNRTKMLLDSMNAGKQTAGRARKQFLGFDSHDAAKVFRAIAAMHPEAMLITDERWRQHAELHMERGYISALSIRADLHRLDPTACT